MQNKNGYPNSLPSLKSWDKESIIFLVEAVNTITHERHPYMSFMREDDAKTFVKEEIQKQDQQRRWLQHMREEEDIETAELLYEQEMHQKACETFFKKNKIPIEYHQDLIRKSWQKWQEDEELEFTIAPVECR